MRFPPCGTERVVLSFTTMLTFPDGERYFFATNRMITKRSIVARNTPMLVNMNVYIASFFLL